MRPGRRCAAAGVACALLVAVAGCGGDEEPAATPTRADTGRDPAAEITAAYTTFFDGTATVAQKVANLEHGQRLRSMLADAAKNPQFKQMTVQVRSVRVLSTAECAAAREASPCAVVVHDLFVGPVAARAGQEGHAVKVGSRWRVSASTWCSLVTIGGARCPSLPGPAGG